MAWTDITTIKKLIQVDTPIIPSVHNERVLLTLSQPSQLSHATIDLDTDIVKILRIADPYPDTGNPITLNTTVPVNLDQEKIVWNTVVVADSLALTTIYVENDDYIIDYFNGTVERTTIGSTIPDGGTVYVWYLYFTVMIRGTDYTINIDLGTIARRAGTTIPDHATVWVDYAHSQSNPTDLAITQCILQTEAYLVPKLKPSFTLDSDDVGLQSSATNYALHLLALSQAFKVLSATQKEDPDSLARQWFTLSDKYFTLASRSFSKYLHVSSLDYGGLIQNRFTSTRTRTRTSPTISPGTRAK